MIVPISPGFTYPLPTVSWDALVPRVEGREYPWDIEATEDGTYLMTHLWTTKSGLPGYAARDPYLGCWGGYVAVLPGHTLHGRGAPMRALQADGVGEPRLPDIPAGVHSRVHDGIKYAGTIPGADPGDQNLWWLGFRCDGPTDYTPGYDFWNDADVDYHESTWPDLLSDPEGQARRTYRTFTYVHDIVEVFAAELARSTRPAPKAG